MNFIKEIFLQNAFSSVKLSFVIILLFALTKPITRRYTAGFRYYSWLALMLIFLVPFSSLGISYTINLPQNITSKIHNIQTAYEEKAPEYLVTEEYTGYEYVENPESGKQEHVPVIKSAKMKKKVDVSAILALIWAGGVIWYFALHYGRYAYFRRGLRRLGRAVEDESIEGCMKEECANLGIKKAPKLKHSALIDTPMLVGIVKPEVVLPRLDYTQEELRLIFRHELFHLKRRDIAYQLLTLIFVSLHWFNPFVHLMAKSIELDGETSCDEKVLEGKSYDERIFYGEMLLKFLKSTTQKRSYMTTTFFGGKNGMKKRLNLIKSNVLRKKGTAAMAVIMGLTILLSVSAAAMENEYWSSIFGGNTSYLADFVKTEKRSVEDERFKLTLEQYLVAEKQVTLICSFEAKTEDAKQEMNAVDERGHSTFTGMDFLMFTPTDYEKAYVNGYGWGSLGGGKFDSETKKYYVLQSNNIKNDEHIDFKLGTDRISGDQWIIVPMACNIETKKLEFGAYKVEYNPTAITLTYPIADKTGCTRCDNGRYAPFMFRVKSGEIKTLNQLFIQSGFEPVRDDNDNEIAYNALTWARPNDNEIAYNALAWAREVIEPDEIKSIIVNDTEYPVDNPSQSKSVTIDEHLKPFVLDVYVKDDKTYLPLRAFCDGLGAEIKWDDDTKTASFKYRGSSYSFTVGKTGTVVDGEECDFGDAAPFIDEYGRMVVVPRFRNAHQVDMSVDMHIYKVKADKNSGENAAGSYVKWHVIP